MSNGKLANDGAQSHCARRASITTKSSSYDVTTQFLLVTRTICTGLSAGIFAQETSHTSIYHSRVLHGFPHDGHDHTVTTTNPPDYTGDSSNYNEEPDNNPADPRNDGVPDNNIVVTVTSREKDMATISMISSTATRDRSAESSPTRWASHGTVTGVYIRLTPHTTNRNSRHANDRYFHLHHAHIVQTNSQNRPDDDMR